LATGSFCFGGITDLLKMLEIFAFLRVGLHCRPTCTLQVKYCGNSYPIYRSLRVTS